MTFDIADDPLCIRNGNIFGEGVSFLTAFDLTDCNVSLALAWQYTHRLHKAVYTIQCSDLEFTVYYMYTTISTVL